MSFVRLNANRLTSFTVPPGQTNLTGLFLSENQLTHVTLPSDLKQLVQIDLAENQLTRFTLPRGMPNLVTVDLDANQLTNVTLAPDATNLASLLVAANPLATFVVSEPMAGGNFAAQIATLRNQGVGVFTYPLAIRLTSPRAAVSGAFEFTLTGPPGAYTVLGSFELIGWNELGAATNNFGTAVFADLNAGLSPRKFYRARAE